MRIGVIGSRKLAPWQFDQYKELCYRLSLDGHTLVSGGAKQGGDRAAEDGANQANLGQNLVLHLSRHFHGGETYPQFATLNWIDPSDMTPQRELASRNALPEQWNSKYRPLFIRNAYVASDVDAMLSWQNGDTRGTAMTLRCCGELKIPLFCFDVTYAKNKWESVDELYTRITTALNNLK